VIQTNLQIAPAKTTSSEMIPYKKQQQTRVDTKYYSHLSNTNKTTTIGGAN